MKEVGEITPWFEPAYNMYEVFDKEEDIEDVQVPEERPQKKLKQATLHTIVLGTKRTETASQKLKRKRQDNINEKNKKEIIKTKKLPSAVMGNLGYINEKLVSQLSKYNLNKKNNLELMVRIQETFIDHLQRTYNQFWKDHFEYLKQIGVEENKIRLFNRKAAVT